MSRLKGAQKVNFLHNTCELRVITLGLRDVKKEKIQNSGLLNSDKNIFNNPVYA